MAHDSLRDMTDTLRDSPLRIRSHQCVTHHVTHMTHCVDFSQAYFICVTPLTHCVTDFCAFAPMQFTASCRALQIFAHTSTSNVVQVMVTLAQIDESCLKYEWLVSHMHYMDHRQNESASSFHTNPWKMQHGKKLRNVNVQLGNWLRYLFTRIL